MVREYSERPQKEEVQEEVDRIYLADMRGLYCINGVREFFDKSGVDWKDFLRNGIETERALKIDGWEQLVRTILATRGKTRG